jgi:hypothetical protein
MLASHHEGFPEVGLVLQALFQLFLRINGKTALIALTPAFYSHGDVHVNPIGNSLIRESLNLLVIVIFTEEFPGALVTSFWICIRRLLEKYDISLPG